MNVVCESGLLVTYLFDLFFFYFCLLYIFFLGGGRGGAEGAVVCVCVFFFSEKVLACLFVTLDLDECRGNNNHCHQNAVCTNTLGSYKCQCATGYTGDGFSCSGKEFFFFHFFLLQGENAFIDCILTV